MSPFNLASKHTFYFSAHVHTNSAKIDDTNKVEAKFDKNDEKPAFKEPMQKADQLSWA